MTEASQAYDDKGKAIPGRRQLQNYFVTKDELVGKVLKRLEIPQQPQPQPQPQSQPTPDSSLAPIDLSSDDEDACVMVGSDDAAPELNAETLQRQFAGVPRQAGKRVVTTLTKPTAPAGESHRKQDEIDVALASIIKQERRAQERQRRKLSKRKR